MKGKCISRQIVLFLILIALCGCAAAVKSAGGANEPVIGMANPASVFCKEQGGVLELHNEDDGGYGLCYFDDGSVCEEWAFFRGECAPGDNPRSGDGDKNDDADTAIDIINPAAVYCEEQGGSISVQYDASGDLLGICAFADGSTCEELAFARGECAPELDLRTPFPVFGWYGTVISPPANQPYEYYLMLSPKEAGSAGLVPMNDDASGKLANLRDSGRLAHFWGNLNCAVPAYNGCQLEVTQVRPEGPGEFMSPDPVEGWEGTLRSMPCSGAGTCPDDVFILAEGQATIWARLFPVRYGMDSADATITAKLNELRDSGASFIVYGELSCGVPDANGCQIKVTRIEAGKVFTVAPLPADVTGEPVVAWQGIIHSTPDGAQFDDYFEKNGYDSGFYGIEAQDPDLIEQLADLRDSGTQITIWGKLQADVPDYGGTQILVTRLDIAEDREHPVVVEKTVTDWVGVVVSLDSGAQIDDYFQMMDQNGTRVGIWGEGALDAQLAQLRDTGTVIHVWGTIRYNVPDAYNAQIAVTRIELD